MDSLAKHLNITTHDKWYQTKICSITKVKGGRELLLQNSNSLVCALQVAYPEFLWFHWLHGESIPKDFWHDPKTHQQYFDWLSEEVEVHIQSDWYKIGISELIKTGGAELVHNHYNDSFLFALSKVYPQWNWRRQQDPAPYWNDHQKQRQFFDDLASKLGMKYHSELYRISREDVVKYGGTGLLTHYSDNSVKAIVNVYPEFEWFPWLFRRVPDNYWTLPSNRRYFFDWLADKLGIETINDWYKVKIHDIHSNGGCGLMQAHFGNCPVKALESVYPEFDWQFWRFDPCPHGYWMSISNQRKFFEWFGSENGINNPEDWYSVDIEKIEQYGAVGLMKHYQRSPSKVLKTIFPDYTWHVWRFSRVPDGFWKPETVRSFFEWLGDKLDITSIDQWYQVPLSTIQAFGGGYLVQHIGLTKLLRIAYPEIDASSIKSDGERRYKAQVSLLRILPQLLVSNANKDLSLSTPVVSDGLTPFCNNTVNS